MQQVEDFSDLVLNSANEFWQAVGDFLPKLLGAILLIILGALLAKIAASITQKVLEFFGVNKLRQNRAVADTLKKTGLEMDFVSVASQIVFWVVLVIFALTAVDVLGLNALRDVIRELLAYLPNVLAAAIVLTVTVAGGRLVKGFVAVSLDRMNVDYSAGVATVAQYAIVVFGTVMALSQLGFDTTILTANVTIIVAGVVAALALAFGLGGKDVAGRIVNQAYERMQRKR